MNTEFTHINGLNLTISDRSIILIKQTSKPTAWSVQESSIYVKSGRVKPILKANQLLKKNKKGQRTWYRKWSMKRHKVQHGFTIING